MNSRLLDIYRQEIFYFLRTVTIKFEPFAYLMGEAYMDKYGLGDPHQEWNPYYINLSGNYSDNDTRMTVYSLEEERHVPFDKDFRYNYPRTADLYRVENIEYANLIERYPQHKGLIRCILYPPKDIKTCIEAENFTLLAYDDSYLHINERENLVKTLKSFLEEVRYRWWIPEYGYEDMYAATFWAMLWQHLPVLLLTQRFKNIKTPYVHPFHIWEYLKSKGIKDYRDVLSNRQTLWLYRNINYILKNKGKQNNLLLLAKNLLEEVAVSLHYFDMYQETNTRWEKQLLTNPKFRAFNLLTNKESHVDSFATLNHRLYEMGIEQHNTLEYINKTEQELATHNYNILSTKYLELRKDIINTVNERWMYNFFLDSLFYRYSKDNLKFLVQVINPVTKAKMEMPVGDAIALWYYAIVRSIQLPAPTYIPTRHVVHIPMKLLQPREREFPKYIYYAHNEYELISVIRLSWMMSNIPWYEKTIHRQKDFIDLLAGQFRFLIYWQRLAEQSNDTIFHLGMWTFLKYITDEQIINFKLVNAETYEEWFQIDGWHRNVISSIEDLGEDFQIDHYKALVSNCFDAIFPLDQATSDEFLGRFRNIEKIYAAVRDLFISLGSYNITYLETERDKHIYLKYYDPDFTPIHVKFAYGLGWVIYGPVLKFKDKTKIDVGIPTFGPRIRLTHAILVQAVQHKMQEETIIDEQRYTWHMHRAITTGNKLTVTKIREHHQQPIKTAYTTLRLKKGSLEWTS